MAEPHSAPPTPPGNEPPDADAPGMGLPGTLIEDPSGMTAADQQGAAEAAAESRRKRQEQQASGSVLAPLSGPTFRMLWLIWMAANTCMWMNDVAAAWLMTSLTTSPVLVALVQSASTLPVFFLGKEVFGF